MIIQLVLVAALLLTIAYAISQYRRSFIAASAIMVVSVVGIGLVANPDMATAIARLVGVGRGVDLLFYVFALVALLAIFNLHLRLRDHADNLTLLIRHTAIQFALLERQRNSEREDRV